MLRAASATAIAQIIVRDLPSIVSAASLRLYLYNAGTKSLESVAFPGSLEPLAVSVDRPPEGLLSAAVQCFRQGEPVNLPQSHVSSSLNLAAKKTVVRAAYFTPVQASGETLGVLEALRSKRFGAFTPDDLAALRMVADLAGASLKVQQQNGVRDQLLRAEKLAANGQLIAGTAADLRPSIDHMLSLTASLPAISAVEQPLAELRAETVRISETVARLTSFLGTGNSGFRTLDLIELLAELIQFRSRHWSELGLRVQNHLSPEPAMIQGQQGRLEHTFLDLVIHAERCASASPAKMFAIASSRMAGRIVIQIRFPTGDAMEEATWINCRNNAYSHAGELQLRSLGDGSAFEMDLPLIAAPSATPAASRANRRSGRVLTLMLVDADGSARHQLLGLLAKRNHRIVPVAAEETSALAQRIRFDGVIWAVRPGGPKWSDYQQGLRELIPAFVLVSTGYDGAFASSLAENGGFLLARPIQESELDRVLDAMEHKTTARV